MLWQYVKRSMLKYPGSRIWEEDASMTYEEAVIFAETFARNLKAPCYGVLCQSELAASLGILSCFAAGVTAVPLSYRYGEQHIRAILEKIHPTGMITDIDGQLQVIDTDTGEYRPPKETVPAVILCTSGTTGTPKGVMLSQGNLLTNLGDIRSYFAVTQGDSILIARPLYHCAVLTGEWLLALSKGMTIHFSGKPCNPKELLAQIETHGITVFGGTPTLLQLLARFVQRKEGNHAQNDPEPLCLRNIVVSGEPLGQQAAARIRCAFPKAQIYHVYGLTEASPRVTFLPPELFDTCSQWVGKPLPSVQAVILDAKGNVLPPNTEGELCIKGDNVMLGYYNDPALTARVLKQSWLHTGDMAEMDENGWIRIKGRKDHMIIRAGMNLYPQEIENALLTDTRVEEVMAYGISDALQGEKIGVLVKGDFSSKEEVYKLCRKRLPPHARPTVVTLVTELVKNGSGKIIRTKEGGRT